MTETTSFSNQLVCIFCDQKSTDLVHAIDHLISHLNYTPFECRYCTKRFSSILDFTMHGQNHMDKKELDFIYEPKDLYDDWLKKITVHYRDGKHLKVNRNENCMICSKYDGYFRSLDYKSSLFLMEECKIDTENEFKINQLVLHPRNLNLYDIKKDQICLIYHIHYHLQYYPYKCTHCEFRVPFIGKEFYDHLKKVHKIEFDLENHNADSFEKSYYIEQLDRLVEPFYKDSKDKKIVYRHDDHNYNRRHNRKFDHKKMRR